MFRSPLRFLAVICIMTVIMLVFVSHKNVLVFSAGPPASGDWIVTGTEIYHDVVIVLNGNLIIENGGNLTFRRVTLKMNCTYDGQYNITVRHGGIFYVLDGSVIISVNSDSEYLFSVDYGSTFRVNNSEIHECGWFDPSCSPKGLNIGSDDAIVENSLLSHNAQGINIWSDGVIVRNNNITMNEHVGIGLWTGVDNATISNNRISLNYVGGIHAEKSSPTIANNTITSNLGDGLYFWGEEANPIIQDNLITLNNGEGIRGSDYCSLIIQGNNVTSNGGNGIAIRHNSTGTIQGNTITNNSMDGIHSYAYSNVLIQGNIIASNECGVRCNDGVQAEIHWNDIYDNHEMDVTTHNSVEYDPSVSVNATYNYWGDGPDPEKISQNVLYDPWLTEPILHVEITSPLSGETVSAPVVVSTEVHAQNGFHKIELYVDSRSEYTDYDMPYEWNWDTTQYTETEHKITVKAYDLFGLKVSTSITVFVDNTAPTVSIREPEPENIYCGMIRVSVNATDNKEIGSVRFKVDNNEWFVMIYNSTDFFWKYNLNTTALSDGQHTLMALVLDKASNPSITSTTFRVDNTPPTLSIQTPQSGMTVGLTLIVSIQASDASNISRIEFYLQDVLVYTVTNTPYQWSWDTTKYPNGEYTITVKAYDTVGHLKTSQTTVTLKNVESPWWEAHMWTIIQVLVAIGGLILAVLTYLTGKKKEKKREEKKE